MREEFNRQNDILYRRPAPKVLDDLAARVSQVRKAVFFSEL